jgi:peroxiredoxin Q/BCP
MSTNLRTGDKAPDFALPALPTPVTLSEVLTRKAVVLFFYPKDETPGCTAEACTFRDSYEAFVEAGAEVIGVSADSLESHAKFAKRFGLPMTLATDSAGAVAALYGVKKTFGLLPGRVTFVIDRQGVIRHVFSSQLQASRHVREALDVLRSLGAAQTTAGA